MNEARELIENGTKEINIIAQDLAAFGLDVIGESQLILS